MSSTVGCVVLFLTTVQAMTPFQHSWDTVGDVMGMHGKYKDLDVAVPQEDIEFVAKNYAFVTTGTGCNRINKSNTLTIEESVLAVAARIKAIDPSKQVGMYWRSDFILELGECSGFASEWAANAAEWTLKDDKGKPVSKSGKPLLDYSNPKASAFFSKVLFNVTSWKLPNGKPMLDYVYVDGDKSIENPYAPGINPDRSAKLVRDSYASFGTAQKLMDAAGDGGRVVLNGMDTLEAFQSHVGSGCAGAMFDHWSILQYIQRANHASEGLFNVTEMDEAFALATNKLVSNFTVQVKGWPGPIIKQRDEYPSGITQPKTPADFQRVIAERFNSELALFLLVADQFNFWIYSWFWGWDDYVPNQTDSTIPASFFPEAKCSLGEPTGPYERIPNTWTYKRQFAHASVFVDLNNRTASKVEFTQC